MPQQPPARATRDWFGESLVAAGSQRDDVVVVNCDLGSATKTLQFREDYPERFMECGIAEANAIGVAAGLAHEGFRPFVASFGHFLTGKYLEIFQSVGLNDSPVVLVGSHAGLAIGKDGPTQMGLRDLALMRTLQNLQVLHPADGLETQQMVAYLAARREPAYLRLCRQPQPEIHSSGYQFRFGVPDIVHAGTGLAVFTMGAMVEVVLASLPELAAAGLDPTIVNVSSLPADAAAVAQICAAHEHVFVAEDHFVKGGVADEIGQLVLSTGCAVRFGSLGVPDYGQAAAPDDLYRRYQLDSSGVAGRLTAFMSAAR